MFVSSKLFGLTYLSWALCCVLMSGLTADTQPLDWRKAIYRADSLAESGDRHKLDSGIVLTKQILEAAVADVGESDPTAIIVRQLLGVYLTYRGDYLKADSIFARVIDLAMKSLGESHEIIVRTLNNRAVMMGNVGFYDSALVMQRRALELTEKYRGPDHSDVALGLNNMAMNFAVLGRDEEREAALKRARDLWASAYGDTNKYTATAISNLGDLYMDQGKLEDAEAQFKTAMAMRFVSKDTSSDKWIDNYLALSDIQIKKENLDSAKSLCESASRVATRALVPSDPIFFTIREQFARIAVRQSKLDEALRIYLQCIEERVTQLGPNQPNAPWDEVSRIYQLKGDPESAFDASCKAFAAKWRSYQLNSYRLTENEALLYFQTCRQAAFGAASSFSEIKKPKQSSVSALAEILMACKGSVSDQVFSRHKERLAVSNPSTRSIALALREGRSKYAELYYEITPPSETPIKRHRLDSLATACNKLEQELAILGPGRADAQNAEIAIVDSISKNIAPDACLIDYFRYSYQAPLSTTSAEKYVAVIVKHGSSAKIVELGAAEMIDQFVLAYQSHMERIAGRRSSPIRENLREYDTISRRLFDAVLAPIIYDVQSSQTIIISPDGPLNNVAFGALKDEGNQYLLENHTIQYVTAGRDLLDQKQLQHKKSGLLAIGDPDFDANPGGTASYRAASINARYSPVSAYTYNQRSVCDQFYTRSIQRLPSTADEIKQVCDEWNKERFDKALALTGAAATETNFKAMAPGRSLLYLATHGYFLDGGCEKDEGIGSDSRLSENPLLLAGVVLAGANRRGNDNGVSKIDDGILTADEISMLDLDGTDLVVLSACESGKGRIEAGEGVYGLRRAFQQAGARSVISTLWKIDDKTTSEMMATLLSGSDRSMPKRLRDVQLQQLQKLRKEGRTDHPYTWGAFVLTGN